VSCRQAFIRTVPRRGFRFVAAVRVESVPPASRFSAPGHDHHPLPPGATIVVRPFAAEASDGHDVEGIRDGVVEDLVTALARRRGLLVLAHVGVSDDRSAPAAARCIADDAEPRYLVQGSIRRDGMRLRVAARLIDRPTGLHVFVVEQERRLAATRAERERVIASIASGIAAAVLRTERQRAVRLPLQDLDAWHAYQRGLWHMSKCEAPQNALARASFARAVELDPAFARAYAALAWSCLMSASIFSEMPLDEGCRLGEPLIRSAIALDEDDTDARARLALASLLGGDLNRAIGLSRQVSAADPGCADAHGVNGAALIYAGRFAQGRVAIARYLQLAPGDPARPIRMAQVAASHYLEGNYRVAMERARQVVREYPRHPTAYRWLAASLGQMGRIEQARDVLAALVATSPSSLDMYAGQQSPAYCSIEKKPMLAGLRKAGWRD